MYVSPSLCTLARSAVPSLTPVKYYFPAIDSYVGRGEVHTYIHSLVVDRLLVSSCYTARMNRLGFGHRGCGGSKCSTEKGGCVHACTKLGAEFFLVLRIRELGVASEGRIVWSQHLPFCVFYCPPFWPFFFFFFFEGGYV